MIRDRVRLLLVFITMGLVISVPPSAAGEIAYSKLTDGYWQIWVYRLDDGAQRQITRGPSDKRAPIWTPDGALVFRANNDRLYRVNARGGAEKPFLAELWPAVDPAFSPDGHRIAFARLRTDALDVSAIWLVDGGGANRRTLTRGPGLQTYPSWSRDGAWIFFELFRGAAGTDLRRVAADGSASELVLEAAPGEHLQKPQISPDGRWLAYASNRTGSYDIWLADAFVSDTPVRRLTESPAIDTWPVWSPDSRSLAFTTQRRGKLEVWLMDADGSNQRALFESDSPSTEPAWR